MPKKETVYLAGKITGDPYFRSKFFEAAAKLEEAGYVVMNPALLGAEGFSYDAYIRMSRAMQDECDAVCFLPDWVDSLGAQAEFGRAFARGQRIFFYDMWSAGHSGELEWQVNTMPRMVAGNESA